MAMTLLCVPKRFCLPRQSFCIFKVQQGSKNLYGSFSAPSYESYSAAFYKSYLGAIHRKVLFLCANEMHGDKSALRF